MNHPHRHGGRATVLALSLIVGAPAWAAPTAAGTAMPVEVWKSPTCGCCTAWVQHLERNGFTVRIRDRGNTAARRMLGMPIRYGSCHTARVGGYVVEGHVPAADIERLLAQKPDAIGVAVPGMPVGTPGMDGPAYRGRTDAYDVLLIGTDGSSGVFHAHR